MLEEHLGLELVVEQAEQEEMEPHLQVVMPELVQQLQLQVLPLHMLLEVLEELDLEVWVHPV
jgi:hypothetical protein